GDPPDHAPGHVERRGAVERAPGPGRDERRTDDVPRRDGTGTRETGSRDTDGRDAGRSQEAPQVTDVPAALLAPA
ncbi:hypothetical protein, partial [Microbispora triticiradicis]|uniref:hypothetical protein n=1 Tax=Microbispora triticiradicis TaxID=2200763 RepID=UPI001AD6B03F